MKISGIYKITNTATGELYVGSSKDIMKRWREHRNTHNRTKYPNNRLYQDMEKYNTDTFTFEVLEVCDNLFEREQYWMDVLKPTYNSKKSYNKENHGICGVYKITCNITSDFYIGSSMNIKERWAAHKRPSALKKYPNSRMYQDMRKYGLQAFTFEVLAEFPPEHLKRKEQEAIETLHPTYNSCASYATEEHARLKNKERCNDYYRTNKDILSLKQKAYYNANRDEINAKNRERYKRNKEKINAHNKKYYEENREKIAIQIKKYRELNRNHIIARQKKYYRRKCIFNGEELTLNALMKRFKKKGISPLEAKKFLIEK
jgi:group I intron endonuclease